MPELAASSATPAPPPTTKRRGNPNLHLAPRCGARTRSGCPCLAPAIQGKARCRMHGGRSTGPRTLEGLQRLRHARLAQGARSAEFRAQDFLIDGMCRYGRLRCAVMDCRAWLPPEFAQRVSPSLPFPPELETPVFTPGPMTVAEERARRREQESTLAPWRRAIAQARQARRDAWHARAAARAARATPPTAVVMPPDGDQPPLPAPASGGFKTEPHVPEPPPCSPVAAVSPAHTAPALPETEPHAPGIVCAPPAVALAPANGQYGDFSSGPHATEPPICSPATAVSPAHGAPALSAPEPHAPVVPPCPPPGLDRRARRHWKWQQREMRKHGQTNQHRPPGAHGRAPILTSALVSPPRPL